MIFHDFGDHFGDILDAKARRNKIRRKHTRSTVYRICIFPATTRIIISTPLAGRVPRRGARRRIPLCGLNPACPCVQGVPPCEIPMPNKALPCRAEGPKPAPAPSPTFIISHNGAPNGILNPSQIRAESSFFLFEIRPAKRRAKGGQKPAQRRAKSSKIIEHPPFLQSKMPCCSMSVFL